MVIFHPHHIDPLTPVHPTCPFACQARGGTLLREEESLRERAAHLEARELRLRIARCMPVIWAEVAQTLTLNDLASKGRDAWSVTLSQRPGCVECHGTWNHLLGNRF